MAVFCHNACENTHETKNNHKVHALIKEKQENLKDVYWLFKNEL